MKRDLHMTRKFRASAGLGLFLLLWFVAGCMASTRIVSLWQAPHMRLNFQRPFVIAISKHEGIRRIIEDEFSDQLIKAGAAAMQSYKVLPAGGEVPKADLAAAVKTAGADATLVVRFVRVEQRTEVLPRFRGFYGDYDIFWGNYFGYYDQPEIYQYEVATVEVDLYRVKDDELVWSTINTVDSPVFSRDRIAELAQMIAQRLKDQGLGSPD
jgi:hypothetical protein